MRETGCPVGDTPDKCLAGVCDECYRYRQRAATRNRWMALWIGIGLAVGFVMTLHIMAASLVAMVK